MKSEVVVIPNDWERGKEKVASEYDGYGDFAWYCVRQMEKRCNDKGGRPYDPMKDAFSK